MISPPNIHPMSGQPQPPSPNHQVSYHQPIQAPPSTPQFNNTQVVKDDLIKWFQLDDNIQDLSVKLKLLKDQKKSLTQKLEGFMEHHNVGDIQSNGQQIKYCKTKTKKSHTKKSLQQSLQNFFHNDTNANTAYQHIMESRETTEKVRLKRLTIQGPPKNKTPV